MSLFLELIWPHQRILITKNKDILILGEGPTQALDDTTLAAEAMYPISFTQPSKCFVLYLHCNGSNRFIFVNATKMYEFKAKDPEKNDYPLCLGNISKDFTVKLNKTWFKGIVIVFSVEFNPTDTNDILNIHWCLIKRKWYKITFGIIKKLFDVLLRNIVHRFSYNYLINI